MRVTMFWHGGHSYAVFNTHDPRDAEEFDSLQAAKDEFAYRAAGNDPSRPGVDETSEAWIVLSDAKTALGADYPDRIIKIGPRGGIVVERC